MRIENTVEGVPVVPEIKSSRQFRPELPPI
jgi:hypothetical protein